MLKKKWQRKRTMEIRAQEQNVLWTISLFRELHPARGEEKHFTGKEDKKWQKNHAEQQDFFSNSSVGRQKTI